MVDQGIRSLLTPNPFIQKIRAPFSGLIVRRFINKGEYVTTMPPTPLFLIMNIDRIKAEVGLPEIHLSQVSMANTFGRDIGSIVRDVRQKVSRMKIPDGYPDPHRYRREQRDRND
jgi:hypothetical protein